MDRLELKQDLMGGFGISAKQADDLIEKALGRSHVRRAIAAAHRGEVAAVEFNTQGEWRDELQRRIQAVGCLRDGVQCLQGLKRLIDDILHKEEVFVQRKVASVRDRTARWWDFRDSGWALGGREQFAHLAADMLENLDEAKVGGQLKSKLGFQRRIPALAEVQDAKSLEGSLVAAAQRQVQGHLPKPAHVGKKLRDALRRAGAKRDDVLRHDSQGFELIVRGYDAGDGQGWELRAQISEKQEANKDTYDIRLTKSVNGQEQWSDKEVRFAKPDTPETRLATMLVGTMVAMWRDGESRD